MAFKRRILVVANVTATADALLNQLRARAQHEPLAAYLLVPATAIGGGREAAGMQLKTAVKALREAGIEAEGSVGDADPVVAVSEVWDPKRFDEIVVSTLPASLSKWLPAALPQRIARLTGAQVAHIISAPSGPVQMWAARSSQAYAPRSSRAYAPRSSQAYDHAAADGLEALGARSQGS
jgi:hypothetical protein